MNKREREKKREGKTKIERMRKTKIERIREREKSYREALNIDSADFCKHSYSIESTRGGDAFFADFDSARADFRVFQIA